MCVMMPRTEGIIIDAPKASRIRPAISIQGAAENAVRAEAIPKSERPPSSMTLWPVRSASVPIGTSSPAISSG